MTRGHGRHLQIAMLDRLAGRKLHHAREAQATYQRCASRWHDDHRAPRQLAQAGQVQTVAMGVRNENEARVPRISLRQASRFPAPHAEEELA